MDVADIAWSPGPETSHTHTSSTGQAFVLAADPGLPSTHIKGPVRRTIFTRYRYCAFCTSYMSFPNFKCNITRDWPKSNVDTIEIQCDYWKSRSSLLRRKACRESEIRLAGSPLGANSFRLFTNRTFLWLLFCDFQIVTYTLKPQVHEIETLHMVFLDTIIPSLFYRRCIQSCIHMRLSHG